MLVLHVNLSSTIHNSPSKFGVDQQAGDNHLAGGEREETHTHTRRASKRHMQPLLPNRTSYMQGIHFPVRCQVYTDGTDKMCFRRLHDQITSG